MLKISLISLFVMSATGVIARQQISISSDNEQVEKTKIIYKNISKYFYEPSTSLYLETTVAKHNENKHSWLWPLCALIQATNQLEVLTPAQSYMLPVTKTIDQYYNPAPPAPAYQDYVTAERLSSRFFDDNQWIAIAYLDAYNRNKNSLYLEKAKMIYTHMIKAGLDTVTGGGLYWKEGQLDTKNTCSNGPGILVALQLYRITKEKKYLAMALSLYQWTNKYLQSPEGLYYDAIKIPSLKVDQTFYTYNTGTMLQSNVLLFKLTNNKKYRIEAARIAAAGKAYFFKSGKLPGNYWFNAVMLRGYEELYRVDHNWEWISFFKRDADRIWDTERDENNLLGTKTEKSLIDQAGMLEIYARLAYLESTKI